MSDIVNTLRELNVSAEDVVTLRYSDGAEVWHINEGHVQESVAETNTANMLAGLLASPVPVYSVYGTVAEGNDILSDMRANDVLDDYDRGDFAFEEYIEEKLAETIYEGEYALDYSTTQHDYKRGRCEISTEVRLLAGDLMAADENTEGRFEFFSADSLVAGFQVSVQTKAGTLTLN